MRLEIPFEQSIPNQFCQTTTGLQRILFGPQFKLSSEPWSTQLNTVFFLHLGTCRNDINCLVLFQIYNIKMKLTLWIWSAVKCLLIETVPKLPMYFLEENSNWLMFSLLKSMIKIHLLRQCKNAFAHEKHLLSWLLIIIPCTKGPTSHIIFVISVSAYGNKNPRNRIKTILIIIIASLNYTNKVLD